MTLKYTKPVTVEAVQANVREKITHHQTRHNVVSRMRKVVESKLHLKRIDRGMLKHFKAAFPDYSVVAWETSYAKRGICVYNEYRERLTFYFVDLMHGDGGLDLEWFDDENKNYMSAALTAIENHELTLSSDIIHDLVLGWNEALAQLQAVEAEADKYHIGVNFRIS